MAFIFCLLRMLGDYLEASGIEGDYRFNRNDIGEPTTGLNLILHL